MLSPFRKYCDDRGVPSWDLLSKDFHCEWRVFCREDVEFIYSIGDFQNDRYLNRKQKDLFARYMKLANDPCCAFDSKLIRTGWLFISMGVLTAVILFCMLD
jgi:hypothetical protein